MLYPYVIYSRSSSKLEGAALIFAHSVQEAKKIGFRSIGVDFTDEYIDLAAERIWHSAWIYSNANQEKLDHDEPHVIDNPPSCAHCEMWGQSPIGDDGFCESCREELFELTQVVT